MAEEEWEDSVEVSSITQAEEDSGVAYCPLHIGGQNLCLARCALFEPDEGEEGGECGLMSGVNVLRELVEAVYAVKAYLKNL